jgi:serine/threonine protein kinase
LLLQRYRLLKKLGKGSFCETFLAIDQDLSLPQNCLIQKFASYQQNWEQKISILGQICQSPQLPDILASFQIDDDFYLVQEFIDGVSLSSLIQSQGSLDEVQIWQVLADVLPILMLIHSHDLIHCDVKPGNLILRNSPSSSLGKNNLVLVDFGTMQLNPVNHQDILLGSPEYVAPEQSQGKPVFSSDLYSLGLSCLYLLTNISPFDLFDLSKNSYAWRDYLAVPVSESLGNILDKLINQDLNYRFKSAAEVMEMMGIASHPKKITQSHIHQNTSFDTASEVNAIAFSPKGDIIVAGNEDKTIQIWDISTKAIQHQLTAHTRRVTSVAFNPDASILATASDDKTIKLWSADTFQEIFTLTAHTNAVKSLVFSSDGKILVSGGWDKIVKFWEVATGREIYSLPKHKLQVSAIALSPNGKHIICGSCDRNAYVWELLPNCQQPHYTLSGHTWAVTAVAVSPDGKTLATGSDDNTIKLWDANNGTEIVTISGHSWSVTALIFSSDSKTLISASRDKTIKLWNLENQSLIASFSGHTDSVNTIAVSPVTQLLASGSKDKTIKLWQLGEID